MLSTRSADSTRALEKKSIHYGIERREKENLLYVQHKSNPPKGWAMGWAMSSAASSFKLQVERDSESTAARLGQVSFLFRAGHCTRAHTHIL
jgi:hypothetical protein